MTTLEDVLASHELRYDEWAIADTDTWLCLCGWVPDMESVDFSEHATRTVDLAVDRLHAAHVAAVIREHWHVVEKVEPKEYVTGTRKVRELAFGDLDTGCIVTYDSNGVGVHGTGGLDLRTAIDLLPTPQASDGTSGGASHPDKRVKEGGHGMSIRDYALLAEEPSRWGKYEAAIQRWERLTRPAPPPTEPNRNGKPRLNAAFAQWMMGLPDGWVTDVPDLTRADQLKAVGNGVVPQQAFSALGRLWAIATAEQVAA